jgi:hypothetical protein
MTAQSVTAILILVLLSILQCALLACYRTGMSVSVQPAQQQLVLALVSTASHTVLQTARHSNIIASAAALPSELLHA